MAFVYWIHHKDHTDMFSQGYIGITKRTVAERYREHVSDSKRSHSRLFNAMNKYGSDIMVRTIVECDIDYAYNLEESLRPTMNIGWNVLPGGPYRVSETSTRPKSKGHRKKLSDANLGKKSSEESRKKLSNSLKLFYKNNPMPLKGKADPDSVAKRERTRFLKIVERDWNVWSRAAEFLPYFEKGLRFRSCENLLGLPNASLRVIFDKFKSGWNPNTDYYWTSKLNN
jgi:hypothetical protein